ncbi:MAG: DUF4321 domain-containing protein [Gemmatimonadota bacterium]|nr:DUF4321 domain-containing protein [Gemmatimonadota bacterium]
MLVDTGRRGLVRMVWTLVLGLFLGGLMTKLAESFLPESATREFLTTAVEASFGPLAVDLVAVGITLGPLTMSLNVLTLVGIAIVALIMRSLI